MEKNLTMKDGTSVVVRHMEPDDIEQSFRFFCELPEEDRKYLRVDVTQRDLVERRCREAGSGAAERLVVVHDDTIVADGALEIRGHGWGENVAELRLIVAHSYQRRGLGMVLARELFFRAAEHRVDRIIARLMRPQTGAHRIMQQLGFHEEFLVPEMVRDRDGVWQDLIILRCNLDEMWQRMETLFESSDWRWHR